jgi:hypothetical protein
MAEETGELTRMRELAERLLIIQAPFAIPQSPPELLVGRLPDGLPLDLPLPVGTRIVGSMRRERPLLPGAAVISGQMTEIVLDVPSAPEDVLHFYEHEMRARGWPLRDNGGALRPGGFTPVPMHPGRTFSREPDGPLVSVRAADLPGRLSDVRINVAPARARPPGFGVLPSLAPPQGVVIHPPVAEGVLPPWPRPPSPRRIREARRW